MKNIENRRNMELVDGFMRYESYRYNSDSIEDGYQVFDLRSIIEVITVDTFDNDRLRKIAEVKSQRKNNALAGAALGGALDSMNGDDSVLDGVLFGAAAGVALSASAEDPEARLTLVFADKTSLSLIVDADEYALLLGAIRVALLEQTDIVEISKPFSESDVESILGRREVHTALGYKVSAFLPCIVSTVTLFAIPKYASTLSDSNASQLDVSSMFSMMFSGITGFTLTLGTFVGVIFGVMGILRVLNLSKELQKLREMPKWQVLGFKSTSEMEFVRTHFKSALDEHSGKSPQSASVAY